MSFAVKPCVNEMQSDVSVNGIDPNFVDIGIAQSKIFILAGDDTTSSPPILRVPSSEQEPSGAEAQFEMGTTESWEKGEGHPQGQLTTAKPAPTHGGCGQTDPETTDATRSHSLLR